MAIPLLSFICVVAPVYVLGEDVVSLMPVRYDWHHGKERERALFFEGTEEFSCISV